MRGAAQAWLVSFDAARGGPNEWVPLLRQPIP